uniref:aminotransferase class V-fold PLP-dependent enzyme n=1 Tax=Pararhizobium sp. IMCC3301 TaxID=3067904 RepID=UPI002740ED0F|nr:aminotransferase class V-fold PLP-dependent enzyme [Pararhizobium sp. IMCC3301]
MQDFDTPDDYFAWYDANGFSRIINVNGTMTSLGGSITRGTVRRATVDVMGRFVKMNELQTKASRVIAQLTGAQSGCITASASAGISLAVAGAITGMNPVAAENLPRAVGSRSDVVVQLGHLCNYGAPLATAIELTGARVVAAGQSTLCTDYQFDATLTENTAAAVYVVSHHVVAYGQIPFARFARIAHAKGVPVIVDAASEYDLTRFIAEGADIAIYSGHKFLGGPTSGIIAGNTDLVRAAYLQNVGIGRGMKVGKESIAGVIAAMEAWMQRDHDGIRAEEDAALTLWQGAVEGLPGIAALKIDDPTGNPLQRLQIIVDPTRAGASAATFARALGQEDPAIIVRNHEVELGYFQLDPCNLTPGQAPLVADTLSRVLAQGSSLTANEDDFASARNGGTDAYMNWKG